MRTGFEHGLKRWLAGLLLVLPAAIPYAAHYAGAGGMIPTGFIQGDQPYYMANAREHFDAGSFVPTYGNPSGAEFDTPRIYFQPQALLMGLLWRFGLQDPGLVFVLFGLVWAVVCARIAIALFEFLFGLAGPGRRLGLAVMFWGGGAIVLAGAAVTGTYALYGVPMTVKGLFHLDPFAGLWCLNFGRTLIYPNEAYYHAIFFGVVLLLLRKRYGAAWGLTLLLCVSHPFTGIELLAIVFAWVVLEVLLRRESPPPAFVAGWGLLMALHVGYYLAFLPSFPEHRMLMEQWVQPWILGGASAAAAYLPVGLIALWRMRSVPLARALLAERSNRLFVVWFLVAFALATHELFTRAHQPLHFTRGYVWLPLFFLGAPLMIAWFGGLASRFRPVGRVAVGMLLVLLLSDNAAWFAAVANGRLLGQVRLTQGQADVLRWVNGSTRDRAVVVSEDPLLGYLSTVYTPARAWLAQYYNTPDAALRERELGEFFAGRGGISLERPEEVVLVFSKHSPHASRRGAILEQVARVRHAVEVFENRELMAVRTVWPVSAPGPAGSRSRP